MEVMERLLETHATTIAAVLVVLLVLIGVATAERSLLSVVGDAVQVPHAEQSAGAAR